MLVLPSVEEMSDGQLPRPQMKEIRLEELLGRDEIKISMKEIAEGLEGKVVMVTGAAGSIGSELCRQLTRFNIKQLIFLDSAETPMHNIQLEFTDKFPKTPFVPVIGDVRSLDRMDFVFRNYHPQVVFHAAAHKHVPLMEDNSREAVKNNVLGTLNTARCAQEYNSEHFVLLSTDKAVNPTNVMGATKRVSELIMQHLNLEEGNTKFVAVRFGNVLGSNGSVIPLFKKQIAEGGPVTVTHPEITRFFMTIPEAVSLVLQAGYYAKGGEIFILDMGQPVKIDTMARNLIRLSGHEPDVDIKVVYTGLRPGEKLYEEILMAEEGLQETSNKLIHIGKPIVMDDEEFCHQLDRLEKACQEETEDMKDIVASVVPTYRRKK